MTHSKKKAADAVAKGRLLAEVQRIKGEGDYDAAFALVDTYGVHFDPALRDEIVARVDHLQLPSYTGFVMPRLTAVHNGGDITDVIGIGKKTTIRETKFGTGSEVLEDNIVNVQITKSNEDFTKTTLTRVTYP